MQSSDYNLDISLLLSVMNQAGEIRLPVQGKSMLPFLQENRDYVVLQPSGNNICVGDVVLYKRGNGYFLHRVVKIQNSLYTIMGDNEINPDKGITEESIVAVVKSCIVKGKAVGKKDLLWKFYSKTYINSAFRRLALKTHKIRKTVVK